ncbi:MAG: o-succinylbenzoate synthase [Cyanobacteriota bacterium]|nr:o-succinylbenzoate synthase [Cyanobacteriota bacterium]
MREPLRLHWRPFSFPLPAALHTAAGSLHERRGWLLRLETSPGACGWGEAAPLGVGAAAEAALQACASAIAQLGPHPSRDAVERLLPALPPPLAFALGAALAEADGWVGPAAGGWRQAPPSAWLLPAGEGALAAAQATLEAWPSPVPPQASPPPFKWKVGVHPAPLEQAWYGELAALLPAGVRLRLDANGGWDRPTAWSWAERLAGDWRVEWLEQPLDPADQEGLEALARRVPVALDESLLRQPGLRQRWQGWQVRRPSQEGDPRPLLRELQRGHPRWMVSTSFETGIGQRWLAHLAALQAEGPTPTAPGLAPGWQAPGDLGALAPETVWGACGGA